MRRAHPGAAAAAAALLAVLPLAAPPALARAAAGHPVTAPHRSAPQRKPSGASAPASSSMAGGPVAGATAAGGPVAGAPVAGAPMAGGPVAGAPMAGGPVAGAPMAGGPVAGGPVAGAPMAGGPVVGGPELAGRGIVVHYPAHGARRLPSVRASSYVIADAGTGQVLAAKDPHGHFLPASTLKVLTADALMPVLNSRASVVTSAMAADVTPNRVGLVKGHAYPVSDLFQALLLISANDAAIALAQATGSYAKGVAMMNAEARRLQADDTVAVRPNGLNAKGQRTSAYDLALFAQQALTMPEFMRIEATPAAMFPLHRRHSIELFNQNTMLNTYRGDLGGKIGWTTASETTFIAWARRDGHTLIVTLMHCVPLTEMTYAAKLLNWGFAMDGKVTPVGTLARPLPASATTPPASGGTGATVGAGGASGAGQLGASQHGATRHGATRHGATGHGASAHRASQHGAARPGRLIQPAGFATIPVTAWIGALALAGLVAAGVVVLRRRAGGESPPGP
jgi:serine-type D-Ala-D-Ala carboxypeptidase (penicillin-binding protein 5/6)